MSKTHFAFFEAEDVTRTCFEPHEFPNNWDYLELEEWFPHPRGENALLSLLASMKDFLGKGWSCHRDRGSGTFEYIKGLELDYPAWYIGASVCI
jgi:hypothetical protein